MAEYIDRASLINNLNTFAPEHYTPLINDLILKEPAADVVEIPKTGLGDLSDGYHTFNNLYFQRCMLFKQIVHDHKDRAWKTRFHEDGEPCFGGGWFLVAIDTPNGAYGYHYEDKYWDLFDCEELPRAKHWDGYTEKDVDRLLSLPDVVERKKGKWIPVTERLPEPGIDVLVKQTFSYPYVTHGWRTATYWEWVAYPSDHKKKNPTSFSSICPGNEFVTHWMPLPEPPMEE